MFYDSAVPIGFSHKKTGQDFYIPCPVFTAFSGLN